MHVTQNRYSNFLRLPEIQFEKRQPKDGRQGASQERLQPTPPALPVNDIMLPMIEEPQSTGAGTKAVLERRLERERLRGAIVKFAPFDVFRECLSIFAKHPERYGPLFKLLQDEHHRLVQSQLSKDERVAHMPGSLWGALTGAHTEYQHEKELLHQKQRLFKELDSLKAEVRLQTERAALATQERDALQEKFGEMQFKLQEAVVTAQAAEREMMKVRSDMDKVQGKNIQLQTVFDAYADADEKQAQRHLTLLRQVEDLSEQCKESDGYLKQLREEHSSCVENAEAAKLRENTLQQRLAEQELVLSSLQAENRSLQEKVGDATPFSMQVEKNCEHVVEFFFGKGTSMAVPKYLRWHGKVLNRKMRKAEVERVISDIWLSKSRYVADKGPMTLADFFTLYITENFSDAYQQMEFAYSLIYGADRYKSDSDCELFLAVLRYEVPEEVYFDQLQMLADFKNCFEENDIALHKEKTGFLPICTIKKTFHVVLPALSSWRYQALCKGLKQTAPNASSTTKISYTALFLSDKDGDQTPLMEELRDGHLHSIQAYIADICEEVHKVAVDECVTWQHIRDAIKRLDPAVDDDLMKKRLIAISKAAKYPSPYDGTGTDNLLMAFADVRASFEKVFIKRVGPDPTGGDMKWAPRTTSVFDSTFLPEADTADSDSIVRRKRSRFSSSITSLTPSTPNDSVRRYGRMSRASKHM